MHPTMIEWLYAREVLRNFGFTADELFFACAPSGHVKDPDGTVRHLDKPVIAVEIRRGDKKFLWTIGAIDMPLAELESAYRQACDDWNAGKGPTKAQFLASRPVQQTPQLIIALRAKGFEVFIGDQN